jgi:hypothetical protein
MKIKTNELTDRALDWAVAKCEGPDSVASCYYDDQPLWLEEAPIPEWKPSTDWSQGGPIIEREKITSLCIDNDWCAVKGIKYAVTGREPDTLIRVFGPTPLVAAMRCYVASKLGDIIDISEELK